MKTHLIKCDQCEAIFDSNILLEEHNKVQHNVDSMSVLGQPQEQEEQPHGEPHQGHQGDTPALRIEAVQGNYEETQDWKF